MTYKLMVSQDAGSHYYPIYEADTVVDCVSEANRRKLPESWLRWTIENAEGDIEVFSPMHHRIFESMKRITDQDAGEKP